MTANDGVATWSATRLEAAIRGRRAHQPGSPGAVRRPHRATQPADQRGGHARPRRAPDPKRTGPTTRPTRGEWRGPLHGLPITIKDAIEVAGIRSTGGAIELTGPCAGRRRAGRRATQGSRRDRVRQDERAAMVGRPADLQRDLRHDEQPVGRRSRTGRLFRRARGGGRLRFHCVRARHRHRRLGAQPVALLRGVRSQAELRRRVAAGLPRSRRWRDHRRGHQRLRADRPERRGPGSAPRRARRPERGRRAWPGGSSSLRRARPASRDYRVGVWFEEPDMPIDREQLEILRSAADQLADAGAKVEDAHPDVDFGEQRDLFFQLISAAIALELGRGYRRVQRRFPSRVARGPQAAGPAADRLGGLVRSVRRAALPGAADPGVSP